MKRVGHDVERELGRFGPASGMAPIVGIWPEAVGPEIARNAWPARLARDGTLHVHAKDSIWAFELTSRAEEIRQRLGDARATASRVRSRAVAGAVAGRLRAAVSGRDPALAGAPRES